jgi:NTE family protein
VTSHLIPTMCTRRRGDSHRIASAWREAVTVTARRWSAALLTCLVVCGGTSGALHAQSAAAPTPPAQTRPRIGVAFGGGSARGLAHVGVVRWFEEHRIPIDLIAGTSMGGLIGGAVASGMSSEELTALLASTDWDEMFGFSPFRYKNIRRKNDARDYPSRIEFGIKRGLAMPLALNSGQHVDFLLARIAGRYPTLASFDDLPTPFRAVAVDLVTAQAVILDKGTLASAMRATMSLPGVFPPVERDGRVLVDGGALNNVPADVVRSMGADVVIAINVGFMGDTRPVSRSMLGLMGQTVDVMMQVGTRAAMRAADIVINPPLVGFGSMDWRRSEALGEDGYRAAEAMKDRLLPLAVDEAEWARYQERRRTRRQTVWPTPQFVTVTGAVPSDAARIERILAPRVGKELDIETLEVDLDTLGGLDRYETVGWRVDVVDGRPGLLVEARPKAHAPPFLMLGVSLQNTTSNDFSFQLAGRYLTFDAVGSGSELRIDGTAGAQPSLGAELYRPIGNTALFVAGAGAIRQRTINFIADDVVAARYSEFRALVGADVGVNLGPDSDLRVGMSVGRLNANVETGDPGLPELHGRETRARLVWRYDGQDSPVVPSSGVRALARVDHIFDAPDVPATFASDRSNDEVTQFELGGSSFWSLRRRDRVFLAGGVGATWGDPLPSEQFQLGSPLRLSAYTIGEFRGDYYGVLTAGYLRGVGRLPDFLGGPIFLGGWIENGSAFDDIDDAQLKTNVSLGVLADTLIGPLLVGGSFDFSGAWRYYIAIGRLF